MIKAALFDMDGVLLDSKEAWFFAFNELGEVSRERFDNDIWGRELEENLRGFNVSVSRFCDEVLDKHVKRVQTYEGTKDVLGRLRLRKAVITNTTQGCARKMLGAFALDRYFEKIYTSDMVEKGKPSPDLIELALKGLGIGADEAVVIGDSESDIAAGRAAGCLTIGIGTDADVRVGNINGVAEAIKKLRGWSPIDDSGDDGYDGDTDCPEDNGGIKR